MPLLPGARVLAREGHVPGGTRRNLEDVADGVDWGNLHDEVRTLLADAQTSGGLLIALPPEAAEALVEELGAGMDDEAGKPGTVRPAIIGSLEEGDPGTIRVE